MAASTRRTALRIDDPAEDVPRLITGGGKACGGEWGLVLRPTEARGVLVLAGKEGTWAWQGDEQRDAVAMPRQAVELAAGVSTLREARKGIAQKPGPGRPTQRCRRYSGSVTSESPEVWTNPLGIFSPPITSTRSCWPLATNMWPTLNALAPAEQPEDRL